jgi:hypothetical protein
MWVSFSLLASLFFQSTPTPTSDSCICCHGNVADVSSMDVQLEELLRGNYPEGGAEMQSCCRVFRRNCLCLLIDLVYFCNLVDRVKEKSSKIFFHLSFFGGSM